MSEIKFLLSYEALWIHDIEAICILSKLILQLSISSLSIVRMSTVFLKVSNLSIFDIKQDIFKDVSNEDMFSDIFASPWINWAKFVLYLIGLGNCGILSLVFWFERTGQAGPYRTLLNQLASFNLLQVQ